MDASPLGLQTGLHLRVVLVRYRCIHDVSQSSIFDNANKTRWPATVYRSFGGFCGATFLCGSGLGSLETAANPYLAVCGPPKHSEIRINFAQAFNGIGSVVAPALASYVFFKDTADNTSSLKTVQWVYLAVGVFAFLLAIVFFFSSIPEVTDADMELQVQETHITGSEKPFWKQYRLFHAAFTQFCYCGAQGSYFDVLISSLTFQFPSLLGSSIMLSRLDLDLRRRSVRNCSPVRRLASLSGVSVVWQ